MSETFKDRLLAEQIQLGERAEKLDTFIKSPAFPSISSIQQSLLRVQLAAMDTYNSCLLERLTWIDKESA
jgi:hypothetical protein